MNFLSKKEMQNIFFKKPSVCWDLGGGGGFLQEYNSTIK
jgi:hypothetical protein